MTQVKMFMDINETQKAVSKSLRNTLNIDLLWESKSYMERRLALILHLGQKLGEDSNSPLYSRVVTGENNGFGHKDLERLKKISDKLIDAGCIVLLSNNETSFVTNLFNCSNYEIHKVQASRFISCDGKQRKKANEVIIYGRKKGEGFVSTSE